MNARNILAKKREFMIVLSAIALIACFVSGCSTFFTHNTDGAPITCRNYDSTRNIAPLF